MPNARTEGPARSGPSDLNWLAGIIEGEGCIDSSHRDRPGARIRVTMNDLDVVTTIQEITEVGTVWPAPRKDGRPGSVWTWAVHGDPARWLMGLLYPYLHGRRRARVMQLAERGA